MLRHTEADARAATALLLSAIDCRVRLPIKRPGQTSLARLTFTLPHPIDFNSSYNICVALYHLLPALATPAAPRGRPAAYFYTRPAA
mmetsp:Transcript_35913/g.115427  ORF Transcript_35913/g.115427 Transcript_35913/m.115427 type:complete len:87 (-) Transcript_35913:565-825(-)